MSSPGIHTFTHSDDAIPSWLQRHVSGTDRGELWGQSVFGCVGVLKTTHTVFPS